MKCVLGLDPGGKRAFAWCVATAPSRPPIRVLGSGLAHSATTAIAESAEALPRRAKLLAAGIDAPLFWSRSGGRDVDSLVRDAIRCLGCKTAGGTVQHVNSLRGACVTQGPVAAMLLRERFPELALSESHPKAGLWLLKLATKHRLPARITSEHIPLLACDTQLATEHERDAAVAALSAWAMATHQRGWFDLVLLEPDPLFPVGPVAYLVPDPEGVFSRWQPAA